MTKIGAVCDVSLLVDRNDFDRARQLLNWETPCLPSATYGWLARDKLISVRDLAVGYSLVSQLVRNGELLVVYLPELLDEISRRLLFDVDHKIPLTDLRALMLASHLELPLLTFYDDPVKNIREHVGARTILDVEVSTDWRNLWEGVKVYRGLAAEAGKYLNQHLDDETAFDCLIKELNCKENFGTEFDQANVNSGGLSLEYLAWDLTPILRDYLEQHILPPEVVLELCKRTVLLIASTTDR
jgi:hypothetical protein